MPLACGPGGGAQPWPGSETLETQFGTEEPEAANLRAKVLTNGFETCLLRPWDQPLAEGKFPARLCFGWPFPPVFPLLLSSLLFALFCLKMYPFPSPFLVSTFAGASLADRAPLGLLLHHPLGRADLPLGHPGGRMGESRVPESHGQPRTFQKMNSLTTASPLPSCWDPRWVGGRGMGCGRTG